MVQICALIFEKNAKTIQLGRTPIPKNDVSVSKATLKNSKSFHKPFANKFVQKYTRQT